MKKNIYLKFVLLLFITIQLWFVYISTQYPVTGVGVEKNENGNWVVSSIGQRNTSEQAGLEIADVIKQVNGSEPSQFASIIKWSSLDQADRVTVVRDNREYEIFFHTDRNFLQNDALAVAIAAVSIMGALLLLMKKNNSPSAKYLALVLLDMGGIYMSLGASIRGDALGKMTILLLVMMIPILFLHFFVVFLKEKQDYQLSIASLKKKYTFFIVSMAFISQLTFFSANPLTHTIYRVNVLFCMICFIIGFVFSLYLLSKLYLKYRREKSYLSTMIKTVWLSLFISFSPIICFSFIPSIIFGYGWANSLYMSIFVFVFPVTLAYLVVTTKLYDIDLVLRRVLLTALIAIVPSGMFVGIIKFLFAEEAEAERLIIAFILFVVLLTYILYSLENMFAKLEPILFPRKYYLQSALKKIAKNLSSITSFREFKDIILIDIVNTLQVNGAALVFKYKDSLEIIKEGNIDVSEIEKHLNTEKALHPSLTFYEINHQEEYTSYFVLTEKRTTAFLGTEEKQWLQLIMTYLAVSLENVHLIRKLTVKMEQLASQIPNEQAGNDFIWFRKLMFELQEKERVRIATDLHDTTMQDLFFLKERLHLLLEKYAYTKQDQAQMVSMIDYIDVINSNLRQSCFELHPYLIKEIGLVRTIEQLVEMEAAIAPFEIGFKAGQINVIEMRDLETKRHIFRMVQELINNAKKHSHADQVQIELVDSKSILQLTYTDDGVGFESSLALVREIGSSGTGIEQIKSRILSLNGQYELVTSRGKGMRLFVSIPMKEGISA
ncbi:two-component system, NarL family, sensor histidine kinase ComP [Paenibacillus sp. 1_12]|uniref:ATP-binding protein n=1 Tax=Paenibacillus sp. 1_12 TaxID=1566278 RepID=UPI0008DFD07F|nr:ATP-binding protein [Paenibacillus sp. 1_12]SFL35633.1 two-component system, NarL family, sensor histidine kinase ComP [Paenibacillus sp. 1_12]